MKKLFLLGGLIAALGISVVLATSAAAPANFAGTWTLDKAKSTGLSQRLQGADSVQWVITQDANQISIETKVSGGQPPAGGGSGSGGSAGTGGGGGMGGGGGQGRGMGGPQTYKLDGSETTAEMGGQMTGKSTMKAKWSNEGKTLELSRNSVFTTPDGERTSTSTQKLELSGEGKILTVTQHSESPRGTTDSTLVFNKQ
jgi:hypothetical protein